MHKFKVTFSRDYLSSSQGAPHKTIVVSAREFALQKDGNAWGHYTFYDADGEIVSSVAAQNVHNIVRLDCDGGGDEPLAT